MSTVYSDTPAFPVDDLGIELRPSASNRWYACPGSAWVSAVLPPLPTSAPAEQGTAAHWVLEGALSGVEYAAGSEAPNGIAVDADMIRYGSAARGAIADATRYLVGTPTSELGIERHVEYSSACGNTVKGTVDFEASSEHVQILVDYKYGTGKYVSAVDNTQLSIYALALRQINGCKEKYYLGILQPRYRDSSTNGAIRWWVMSNAMMDICEKNLLAAIARARMSHPVYKSGEHCFFCPGKSACPAVCADFIQALVKRGPTVNAYTDPLNLWVLDHEDSLKMISSRIRSEVTEFALAGGHVNGYVIKKYFGKRSWKSGILEQLKQEAAKQTITEPVTQKTEKPIGIIEAEKLGLNVDSLVEKPEKQKIVKTEAGDTLNGFF